MKPIEAISGLPRSADVARIVASHGRQGESQIADQSDLFRRQMMERSRSVNEPPKSENNMDGESTGGNAFYQTPSEKRKAGSDGEEGNLSHPTKGKVLDIRGA